MTDILFCTQRISVPLILRTPPWSVQIPISGTRGPRCKWAKHTPKVVPLAHGRTGTEGIHLNPTLLLPRHRLINRGLRVRTGFEKALLVFSVFLGRCASICSDQEGDSGDRLVSLMELGGRNPEAGTALLPPSLLCPHLPRRGGPGCAAWQVTPQGVI